MSSSNSCFLTFIQVSQKAGQVVWYSHLLKDFPQFIVIHRVKGFGIVNKADIDVFLELSCFFDDPADVGNLIFGSSAFAKTSLNIWNFMVQVLLKPGLENIKHYFTSNCAVVWAVFGIASLWDWNENWPFPVLWPLLNYPDVWYLHNKLYLINNCWINPISSFNFNVKYCLLLMVFSQNVQMCMDKYLCEYINIWLSIWYS